MVKHVVMWKYSNKKDSGAAKELLESMNGKVAHMERMEVGEDFLHAESSYDIVLITEHKNRKELDLYQKDNFHVQIKRKLSDLESVRAAVDFEF
jgi:hypothetical protein